MNIVMRGNPYSVFSILLSLFCVGAILVVNVKIANHYLSSDGKTKLLFGLVEMLNYSYKYYFVLVGVVSISISLIGKRKQEGKGIFIFSLVLMLISLTLILLPIWKIMV
ncbi:MAG: hypothetical protein QM786_12200 [Breznakibacter sp.]